MIATGITASATAELPVEGLAAASVAAATVVAAGAEGRAASTVVSASPAARSSKRVVATALSVMLRTYVEQCVKGSFTEPSSAIFVLPWSSSFFVVGL